MRMEGVPDLAYADDLVSVAATPEALQRKADLVSAFMAIFQMQIVPKKLRTVWFDFKRERNDVDPETGEEAKIEVTVRGVDWSPVTLECKKRGTMKYLGVIFGGKSDGEEQYRETLGTVKRLTELVCRRKASAGLKIAVLNMCVLTKAAYPARFCQWDEGRMKRIERVFSAAYKRITKNMRSFPDQLVYMAAGDGGLGMPNFQDRVFKDTVAMLQRVWKSGG